MNKVYIAIVSILRHFSSFFLSGAVTIDSYTVYRFLLRNRILMHIQKTSQTSLLNFHDAYQGHHHVNWANFVWIHFIQQLLDLFEGQPLRWVALSTSPDQLQESKGNKIAKNPFPFKVAYISLAIFILINCQSRPSICNFTNFTSPTQIETSSKYCMVCYATMGTILINISQHNSPITLSLCAA